MTTVQCVLHCTVLYCTDLLCNVLHCTALCFAVDANHGHVARSLLEAGSDPDVMTQEGIVAADLVNTARNSMLRDIILKFSKHRSKIFAKELLEDKKPLNKNNRFCFLF